MPHDLLQDIGLCITVAASLAFIAKLSRQPLTLAYLSAGVIIGPIGLQLISDKQAIDTISEIGLILLLYLTGLEIDLKKIKTAGKPVVLAGTIQFLICAAAGFGFFSLPVFGTSQQNLTTAYLAAAAALSSTMIAVKLLYDKFELDTLAGRITLGVLVFQDLWAILLLTIQPNLLKPELISLVFSAVTGLLLVTASLAVSKYVLPGLFHAAAKLPELVLLGSLAWCFLVAGGASYGGLSREMGALVAGISISTFPYNRDVIAKVTSIRDFFVTLFFVALGLKIPLPDLELIGLASAASLFIIATRFVSIFPILYSLKLGLRASLLPCINLAQMSEFSLVLASLGLAYGHIAVRSVSLIIFTFVITCVTSTYMIGYSHQIQEFLGRCLKRLGLSDLGDAAVPREQSSESVKKVALLGFYREASSLLHEFELMSDSSGRHPLLDEVIVIDFNPHVHEELKRRGIDCMYGDVAYFDTLQHAEIGAADLVISTIPDSILKGTDNQRLMKQLRHHYPEIKIVVTSESTPKALELYSEGADYVFIPRLQSARELARIIEDGRKNGFDLLRKEHLVMLKQRNEVIP